MTIDNNRVTDREPLLRYATRNGSEQEYEAILEQIQ
jgi:hypothetical protein